MTTWLDVLKFNDDGLIPAIAQDKATGRILMMAWQNREALMLTIQTGQAVYFSRSRGRIWHKGETSGHTQIVHEIYTDCDADVITLIITQKGGIACHTGRESCFYQKLDVQTGAWVAIDDVLKNPDEIYGVNKTSNTHELCQTHTTILGRLNQVLVERKTADKDSSYVASLYHKGLNKILEKVGEEAVESILAAKELQLSLATSNQSDDKRSDLVYEMADLWFHSLVALSFFEITGDEILAELARRFGLSGIDEKNARTAKPSNTDELTR